MPMFESKVRDVMGPVQKTQSTQPTGVPLLSNIPWLGWLFKKETVSDSQNELLIVVTPHLFRDGGMSVSSLASP
jgi:type IV pilus assembly protein PilQ